MAPTARPAGCWPPPRPWKQLWGYWGFLPGCREPDLPGGKEKKKKQFFIIKYTCASLGLTTQVLSFLPRVKGRRLGTSLDSMCWRLPGVGDVGGTLQRCLSARRQQSVARSPLRAGLTSRQTSGDRTGETQASQQGCTSARGVLPGPSRPACAGQWEAVATLREARFPSLHASAIRCPAHPGALALLFLRWDHLEMFRASSSSHRRCPL